MKMHIEPPKPLLGLGGFLALCQIGLVRKNRSTSNSVALEKMNMIQVISHRLPMSMINIIQVLHKTLFPSGVS